MKTFRIKVDTILLLVPLIVFSTFAHAETFTLNEALGIAYETNPQLNAQRAALRASDEEVAKALAGWRPTIAANGSYGAEQGEYHSVPGPQSGTNPRGATVTLTQPLLNGTAFANTRRAKFLVQAGRGQLTATEETVLLNAVTAYMDVVRNQDVVELEQNYGQALRGLRQAVADRFRIGELSRTDVAQTEARLSGAGQIQAYFNKTGVRIWPERARQIEQTVEAFPKARLERAVRKLFEADRALRDARPDDRVVMEEMILALTAR